MNERLLFCVFPLLGFLVEFSASFFFILSRTHVYNFFPFISSCIFSIMGKEFHLVCVGIKFSFWGVFLLLFTWSFLFSSFFDESLSLFLALPKKKEENTHR